MPRKRNDTIDEDPNDDEFDFLSSQPGNSSEDQILHRAILERAAAAQEKKTQERNKRFLDTAARELDKLLLEPSDAVKAAAESIEEVYGKFILDYAAAEDRIHHLWAKILKHHSALDALIRDKHKAALELAKVTEEKHVSGLSKMKGASDEYKTIIQTLVPEDVDEDMMSL